MDGYETRGSSSIPNFDRERCGWQTLEILFIHAKFDIEAACFLRFSYSTIEFHPREDSWNLAYERNNFPSWSSILTKDPRSNLQRGYYLTKIRSVYIYIYEHTSVSTVMGPPAKGRTWRYFLVIFAFDEIRIEISIKFREQINNLSFDRGCREEGSIIITNYTELYCLVYRY